MTYRILLSLRSTVFEASVYNLPDSRSMLATQRVLQMIDASPEDAVFVALISGLLRPVIL